MTAFNLPADPTARALLALAIIAAGMALYWALNRALLLRAQRGLNARRSAEDNGLAITQGGQPTILYFTTPECAPCRTIQRPALQRLQDQLGDDLRVIEVDAQARPDLASQWGVLSVPTTFIIDAGGKLRHVNHGATRAEKLLQQLQQLGQAR